MLPKITTRKHHRGQLTTNHLGNINPLYDYKNNSLILPPIALTQSTSVYILVCRTAAQEFFTFSQLLISC